MRKLQPSPASVGEGLLFVKDVEHQGDEVEFLDKGAPLENSQPADSSCRQAKRGAEKIEPLPIRAAGTINQGGNFSAGSGGSVSLSMGHNCAEAQSPDLPFRLSGSQKKTAFALRKNAERMIAEFGIERIAFVTFTLGERGDDGFWKKVYDPKEAAKLWHVLSRRKVGQWFERLILVTERHKDGGFHLHGLAVVAARFGDIRAGFDFEAVRRGDYSSAPEGLRRLWKEMREVLPEFGFGRAQTEPVKSCGEAVAAYVAKYIEKNLFNRPAADKGSKLVRYIGWNGEQLKPNEFSWATPRACAWRTNARRLANLVGVRDRGEVAACFGPRWAWRLSRVMNAIVGNDQHVAQLGNSTPVLESARQLVLREACRKWVKARRAEDSRRPFANGWNYRTPKQRRQFNFAAVEAWQTTPTGKP